LENFAKNADKIPTSFKFFILAQHIVEGLSTRHFALYQLSVFRINALIDISVETFHPLVEDQTSIFHFIDGQWDRFQVPNVVGLFRVIFEAIIK
jgi:hypothetical protein